MDSNMSELFKDKRAYHPKTASMIVATLEVGSGKRLGQWGQEAT